jgi:endo-1,4-beta-xylanase
MRNPLIRTMATLCTGICFCMSAAGQAIPEGGKPILQDPLLTYAKERSGKKGSTRVVEADGPGFTKALEVESKVRGNNWEYIVVWRLAAPLKKGDVILLHYWARTVYTADESGQSVIKTAIEVPNLWRLPAKEKTFLAPLTKGVLTSAGKEWKQYFVRAQAPGDLPAKGVSVALRCGEERQRVQFGGIGITNYGTTRKLDDLPITHYSYAGRELNAPWRQEAAARIRQHRTRGIQIVVQDKAGKPVANAKVELELTRHAFQFGAAFRTADVLEEYNPNYQQQRQQILENFSSASFVNALKWHPWVGDWGGPFKRENTLAALRWVQEQKLPFRGHCLVWPRKSSVSKAVRKLLEAEKPDPAAIQLAILEHIRSIGPATSFWMDEWDVLNESIPCHDVQDLCGDEVMVEWFKEARRVLPGVKLALNEYSILSSLTDGRKVPQHEERIRFLLDHEAPVDVLGMQSHMGGSPPSPLRVLRLLDRFATFGLPIRATEFDVKATDPGLVHDFTRDFYTAMFSHPSVIGVQMWGIGQMYDKEGKLKPVGKAHRELVLGEWHTNEQGKTDPQGTFARQGFLGTYRVTITANGVPTERTIQLPKGDGAHILTIAL